MMQLSLCCFNLKKFHWLSKLVTYKSKEQNVIATMFLTCMVKNHTRTGKGKGSDNYQYESLLKMICAPC